MAEVKVGNPVGTYQTYVRHAKEPIRCGDYLLEERQGIVRPARQEDGGFDAVAMEDAVADGPVRIAYARTPQWVFDMLKDGDYTGNSPDIPATS